MKRRRQASTKTAKIASAKAPRRNVLKAMSEKHEGQPGASAEVEAQMKEQPPSDSICVNAEVEAQMEEQSPSDSICVKTNLKATHLTDIDVRADKDIRVKWITSLVVLPNNKLVLTDTDHHKIMVVDTKSNEMVSFVELAMSPWAVCKATDTSVAVTLYDDIGSILRKRPKNGQIVFVDISPTVNHGITKTLKVQGSCLGIAIANDRMYVTFKQSDFLKIMDLKGTVLNTITPSLDGRKLLKHAQHITSDPDNQTLYVSNMIDHNVVCLSLEGEVLAIYIDQDLKAPQQACLNSRGWLYVAGHGSNNVHVITRDCRKKSILLDNSQFPHGMSVCAVSYCKFTNKLYLGMNDCNVRGNDTIVKVFQLNYV